MMNLYVIVQDDGRWKVYAIAETGKTALKEEYNRLIAMVQDGIALKGEG